MKNIKTKKSGNSITVTVPKSFNISSGVSFKPILMPDGIFYKFADKDDFWDFDADILTDLINQGYKGVELVKQFKQSKKSISSAIPKLVEEAKQTGQKTTKREFEREIGL